MNCPHCKTEISEHEAGRCLDAWVARSVFGRDTRPDPDGDAGFVLFEKGWGYGAPVAYFSTDIAAAWEVIEKTCNWDVDDNMMTLQGQGLDGTWWVADIGGTRGHFIGEADAASFAICRAALKAFATPS